MDDIAPKLIENVNKDFADNLAADKNVAALSEKLAAGQARYEDAYKYAESVGNARAKAFEDQISSEVLPEGKMHYNIASRLMTDSLTTDHEMIADYAAGVQKAYNEEAGINLKALKADANEDRIDGFVERLSSEDVFDDVSWILQEPVVTHARSVVDDTIKKNAEFQGRAGIKATVIRNADPKCCKWCSDLAGDYVYPSVPREVFQRHDNCRCTADYNGKKLTAYNSGVNSRTFRDQGGTLNDATIKDREEYIQIHNKSDILNKSLKEAKRQELVERQKIIEKIENTPFFVNKSLSAAAKKFYVEEEKLIKNTDYYIKPGTYVTGVKVLCSGDKIREVNRLIEEYKLQNNELTKAKDWYKVRGRATVTNGKNEFSREIHWYQAENIGKVEFKFPSNKKQR